LLVLAIAYHSPHGHTALLAERVARGAAAAGASVSLIDVASLGPPAAGGAEWDALHAADAIAFGCPTYMGSVTAPFKAFMDATSPIWAEQRWKEKLAGGFTNGGALSGNKENTLHTLAVFAAQHGMLWVPLGLMPGKPEPGALNRLGGSLGAHAQSESAPPGETPPEGDLLTAERYGERLAACAARWRAGARPAHAPEETP